jgi:hypothetical protein
MNITPRQTIKYLDKNNQIKTGVIASISKLRKVIQISKGDLIRFDQVIQD